VTEEILSRGKVDFIAMARPFVSDPEFIRKILTGKSEDVRPCVRCNTCCGRSAFFKKTRCSVNPINGHEVKFPNGVEKAKNKKKIMIVGGGAAGMQASITAVERGHEVVLYEKDDKLDGTLNHATDLEFKKDLKNFLEWIVRQTQKCGAKINLNSEVDEEVVKK